MFTLLLICLTFLGEKIEYLPDNSTKFVVKEADKNINIIVMT